MLDPAAAAAFALAPGEPGPQQLEPQQLEPLKCPRCDSSNTKFCYYNNYNLSQPRHFCKNCRRYWTKGGSLRNVPVGGGTRKNSKRPNPNPNPNPTNPKRPSSAAVSDPKPATDPNPVEAAEDPRERSVLSGGCFIGSFSSLLQSDGLLDGGSVAVPDLADLNRSDDDGMLGWPNGWPDLAIYTPGTTFQ